MKKLIFIIVSAAFFIISCAGTKPIKVDNLDSEVFTVNHIVLTSNTIEPSDEELIQIFQSLPYEEICDLVEEKTGIVLDMSLIDNEYIKNNIEYTYLCDLETDEVLQELKEWELNFEVPEDEELALDEDAEEEGLALAQDEAEPEEASDTDEVESVEAVEAVAEEATEPAEALEPSQELAEETDEEDENYETVLEYVYEAPEAEDQKVAQVEQNEGPVTENGKQLCDLYFTMDPPDGYLRVKVVMQTTQTILEESEDKKDKVINYKSTCYETFEKWTFKNIFVDPRSCAQIKFQKNLEPTFIQNELYSVYSKLNTSEDGYINLNVKEPVEIRCNINDPGNMFFSPAEIYNAAFSGTFQPGKKYLLKYKLKRRSPDSNNWVVVFTVKEEKPKLTK